MQLHRQNVWLDLHPPLYESSRVTLQHNCPNLTGSAVANARRTSVIGKTHYIHASLRIMAESLLDPLSLEVLITKLNASFVHRSTVFELSS